MGLYDIESAFLSMVMESTSKVMTKSLMSLKANDVIKAEIMDITPDCVKLKLWDNSVINARSLVIPEASIGQSANFLVKSNNNGQIALEFLRENTSTVPESLVKNILNTLEIPASHNNTAIITAMLENNIPVNEENVNKAMFFRYSMPENSIDDAIFLLKENMPPNFKTIEIFKNITNNKDFLKNNISAFAKLISELPKSEEKNIILDKLGIDEKSVEIYNKVVKKLFVDTKVLKNDSAEIPRKLSAMESTVSSNLSFIKNNDKAQNIKNIISFMKNIDTTKQFVQIPLLINGKEESCDLYIFHNKKKSKTNKKILTMLLSLDTSNLGKIEIYIEKNINNLNFQFRLENPDTVKLIKSNIKTLSTLLKVKNLNLAAVSYIDKNEKFSIMKKSENTSVPKQRYSFDMHV